MKSKKFGKESKITAAWAIAGFFVSSQIIPIGRFSLFGYPLLALSILLAILAIWQASGGKNTQSLYTYPDINKICSKGAFMNFLLYSPLLSFLSSHSFLF